RAWKKLVSLALAGLMIPLPGCTTGERKLTYIGESDLKYYEGTDLEIDHPTVDEPTPDRVAVTRKPRRLGDRSHDEVRDISLAEAIHLSLLNNRIIRVRGDFRTGASALYTNPDG